MVEKEKLIRIRTVEPLEGYKLKVGFTDGTFRVIDFENELKGPIFGPLKELALFRQVKVEYGTLVWPTGADVCPDELYYGGLPPWAKKRLQKIAR
ncbi:MAG: DUF2442 domain-containing protein [Planctomycetes bacterium]|nr:DUF2442 domain-containing protein [Planctomycetota bacterium]